MLPDVFVPLSDSSATILVLLTDFFVLQFGHFVDYAIEAAEHFVLAVVFYCIICVVLYVAIAKWRILSFESELERPCRVLLITAHPDDECMFFGPTLLNLTRKGDCTVYLMCLSKGTDRSSGKVRKNELFEACKVLGVNEGCVVVHSHSLLPDSMTEKWPVELIAEMVLDQIEKYSIDTVITFDKHGISRHANHCSIYYAIAYLIIEQKTLPKDCKVYVLETVNVLRKYSLIFDIPICYLLSSHRYILSVIDYNIIITAMRQHKSQLVWFRCLYLLFSRYVIINTLQQVELTDLELDIELDD